jgi:redox-sensing transcriptional repressor
LTSNQETASGSLARLERLRRYLAALGDFSRRGVETVSSHQLSSSVGVRASLVRRDLSSLGHLGRPGKGYGVADLETGLRRTLRLERKRPAIWLGAGGADWGLIRAALRAVNCELVGLFDDECEGRRVGGLVVQPLARAAAVAKRRGAQVAVLATPAAAQTPLLESLSQAGVRAVLNLTPARLEVSAEVVIEQGDIGSQLLRLLSRMV